MTQFAMRNDPRPQKPLAEWLGHVVGFELACVEIEAFTSAGGNFTSPLNTVVRGMFGKHLRDLRCVTRAERCEGCPSVGDCDYGRIFETPSEVAEGGHGSHAPHPFWLQGVPAVMTLGRGRSFVARLCVVGPAREALPYLDVALRMALRDVGSAQGPKVFEVGASRVRTVRIDALPAQAGLLDLRTETPVVGLGKVDERAIRDCRAMPWLPGLMRAGVRRVAALSAAYGRGRQEASAAYPDLRSLRCVDGGLRSVRMSRWSARQEARMPHEGLDGAVRIEGESVTALRPLFHVLEYLSVGKNTSMGFGEITVR